MSIKKILDKLVEKRKSYTGTMVWDREKEIAQAEAAILKKLEGMMPKERNIYAGSNEDYGQRMRQRELGFNACLADLKSSLKKEGGV